MLRNEHNNKNVLVFSQWSRKTYAIFASLKRVVNIAHLNIDLCESALLKSSSDVPFFTLFDFREDELDNLNSEEIIENQNLIVNTIPVICNNIDVCQQSRIIINAIKSPYSV
jgi:hypothetical protein